MVIFLKAHFTFQLRTLFQLIDGFSKHVDPSRKFYVFGTAFETKFKWKDGSFENQKLVIETTELKGGNTEMEMRIVFEKFLNELRNELYLCTLIQKGEGTLRTVSCFNITHRDNPLNTPPLALLMCFR